MSEYDGDVFLTVYACRQDGECVRLALIIHYLEAGIDNPLPPSLMTMIISLIIPLIIKIMIMIMMIII